MLSWPTKPTIGPGLHLELYPLILVIPSISQDTVGCAALTSISTFSVAQHKRHLFLVHRVSFWDICSPFGEWAVSAQDLSQSCLQEQSETEKSQVVFLCSWGKNTHHCYLHFIGQERPMPLFDPAKWHLCVCPEAEEEWIWVDITPAHPLCFSHTDL